MKLDFSKFTGAVSGSMTTAKAVLLFFPPGEKSIEVSKAAPGGNAADPSFSGRMTEMRSAAEKTIKGTKEQLDKMKNKVRTGGDQISAMVRMAASKKAAPPAEDKRDNNYVTVTFQFNPAVLHISAYGGGMAPITSYGSKTGDTEGDEERDGCGQVDYGPIDETVTVSFKVVFDAVNNARAFLTDMINLSPTNLVRQEVDQASGAAGTVRPVVEGFLAAVRNSSTRRVIFQWGEMRYGGYLNKVQCRYTMFDAAGEAVRAQIDLSLVGSCHDDYDNGKEWRARYDAFMKEGSSAVSLSDGRSVFTVNALSGQVEKAYILFHAQSKDPNMENGEVKGKTILKTPVFNGLSDMAAGISNAANRVTGKKPDIPGLKRMVEASGYVPVRIQYNPSSITMHSRGGKMVTRAGNSEGALDIGKFQKNAMPTETVLSMELFFDDTYHSVAPVSELFVAATASAYSRMVCIVWNRMVFWGELCEVEVEYTMFNNRGNPVRSKVSINVRQDGESSREGASEKNWWKAYCQLPEEADRLASNR